MYNISLFFFSSRRRHTRLTCDWSSDVCSSDLDAEAARDIFTKYVLTGLPLHPDDVAENGGSAQATVSAMIQRVVERMYSETEENRFLEVTYANGDKEVLYFKDFNSGAMIQN